MSDSWKLTMVLAATMFLVGCEIGRIAGSFLGFHPYLDGPHRTVIREVTDSCEIPVALQDAQQRHSCINR